VSKTYCLAFDVDSCTHYYGFTRIVRLRESNHGLTLHIRPADVEIMAGEVLKKSFYFSFNFFYFIKTVKFLLSHSLFNALNAT